MSSTLCLFFKIRCVDSIATGVAAGVATAADGDGDDSFDFLLLFAGVPVQLVLL